MTTSTLDKRSEQANYVKARNVATRPGLALVCISLAALMVALDATVINIALPSAQRALGFSNDARQWVVTAYTVSFGGLLLLGGRIADSFGRKRTFLVGLAGFAAASAAGGAAPDLASLLAARAAQGAFAALLTPTALSLLALSFTEARSRARAFAIFGAIAGTGGALGLLLGGALTEYLDWRWCLYVNVAIAMAALVVGRRALPDTEVHRSKLDTPGALLVSGGLFALVFGFSRAATAGWSSPSAIGVIAGGVAILVAFVVFESRVASPLLPLRIPKDKSRAGSYVAIGFAVVAMYGLFLLLTYDFQVVLRYSPVRAGIAFLPLSAASMLSSTTISRALLARIPPRVLMASGLIVGAVGMWTLTGLGTHADYLTHVLPAELLLGIGMGAVFVPAFSTATLGVTHADAGVASALANTSQQVGASLGVALLNTIAASATAAYLRSHSANGITVALVHGYAEAAGWAAGILAAAAVLVVVLVRAPALSAAEQGDAK